MLAGGFRQKKRRAGPQVAARPTMTSAIRPHTNMLKTHAFDSQDDADARTPTAQQPSAAPSRQHVSSA